MSQRHEFMLEVVREVARGRMVPARFQRPYVWSAKDVTAMFQSIVREWPLGAFLAWTPDEPGAHGGRTRIGPIEVDPATNPTIILDGQNRLASFAWAISQARGERPDPDGQWWPMERETWLSGQTLVADHELRDVLFVPADEALTATRIPVGSLCDGTGTMKAIRLVAEAGGSDDAIEWFDRVADKIRSARVTFTTIERAPVAMARQAFLNICRAGVPMSEEDFDAAVGWSADTEAARAAAP